jgi:hypothetical protein
VYGCPHFRAGSEDNAQGKWVGVDEHYQLNDEQKWSAGE